MSRVDAEITQQAGFWKLFKNAANIWWRGSRLKEGGNSVSWQLMMAIEDHSDGFTHMEDPGKKDFIVKFMNGGSRGDALIKHLLSGPRRKFSTLVCTFIIPVLPIEIGFRYLNAAIDTWHQKVIDEGEGQSYSNKTAVEKGWYWTKRAISTVAKVCARVTDFMIVTPANGLRNFVDAVPTGVVPIQAAVDAYNAKPDQGVKQFFKTWGSGILAAVKGLFKASRPAVVLAPFGVAAPVATAMLASGVSHVPHVGTALTHGLTAVSHSGSYLPGLVHNASAATATGVLQAATVSAAPFTATRFQEKTSQRFLVNGASEARNFDATSLSQNGSSFFSGSRNIDADSIGEPSSEIDRSEDESSYVSSLCPH